MSKVVSIFMVLFIGLFLIQCKKPSQHNNKRRLLKEIVIEHSKTDSAYRYYGCMKEVYRIYNCEYREVKCEEIRTPDLMYGTSYYYNDFGDIVHIIYTDYTNYPRREE